jgi:hypothetical protein
MPLAFPAARRALAAALALLAFTVTADAAERSGRLAVTIEVERDSQTTSNGGLIKQKLRSKVQCETTLRSDGELQNFNPIDPAEHARQMQVAAKVQQRVAAAAPARPMDPNAQADMVARAQKLQALCGQDRDCLMREAMKLSSAQSGLDASGQAKLQAYGAGYVACEKRHPEGKARQACIADARRQAGGRPDATDTDDEAPAKYLSYLGLGDCQVRTHVTVDLVSEGTYPDVQGQVPFKTTVQADGQPATPMLCTGQQIVLDTQAKVLWSHGAWSVNRPNGVTVRAVAGRKTERTEGDVDFGWGEATPWISEQLRRFPKQADLRHVVPVSDGTGQIVVRMRWNFVER